MNEKLIKIVNSILKDICHGKYDWWFEIGYNNGYILVSRNSKKIINLAMSFKSINDVFTFGIDYMIFSYVSMNGLHLANDRGISKENYIDVDVLRQLKSSSMEELSLKLQVIGYL